MEKHYITPEGKKELEQQLDHYKKVLRKEAAARVAEARAMGDLSENSEHDEAKAYQGQIEDKIAEMEDILLNYELINKKDLDTQTVSIGNTVVLYDEDFDEEVTFKILGSTESDPKNGIISNVSPVGTALLGHKKGDTVSVQTVAGTCKYKILSIKI